MEAASQASHACAVICNAVYVSILYEAERREMRYPHNSSPDAHSRVCPIKVTATAALPDRTSLHPRFLRAPNPPCHHSIRWASRLNLCKGSLDHRESRPSRSSSSSLSSYAGRNFDASPLTASAGFGRVSVTPPKEVNPRLYSSQNGISRCRMNWCRVNIQANFTYLGLRPTPKANGEGERGKYSRPRSQRSASQ